MPFDLIVDILNTVLTALIAVFVKIGTAKKN